MFTLRAGTPKLLVLLAGFLTGGGIIGASAFVVQGTWYEVGVAPTACGQMHYDNEYVVALGHGIFDTYPGANTDNPNTNPICNKLLQATHQGKSVVVKVVDRCGDCPGRYDTDFSPAAFTVLAPQSEGRIKIEWKWVPDSTPVGPAAPSSGSPSSSTPEDPATSVNPATPVDSATPVDPATPVDSATSSSESSSSSTAERRFRTRSFGRRKPLDPPPVRAFRAASVPSTVSSVPKPVKRRYLTAAERTRQQTGS